MSVNVFSIESTNWGHYFYVSFGRRDRHFKWSSEPREGQAICRAKAIPSFFSHFKTLSVGPATGIEPAISALRSNALPTQLILVISDVNECKKEPSPCYHEENTFCVNTKGSYHCKCKTGFSRKDDKCVGEYRIFSSFSLLIRSCARTKSLWPFYFFLKVKECNRLGLGLGLGWP